MNHDLVMDAVGIEPTELLGIHPQPFFFAARINAPTELPKLLRRKAAMQLRSNGIPDLDLSFKIRRFLLKCNDF